VFFTALGIQWEYEVEGYDLGQLGYYLPDFWLPGISCFAEVKPETFTEEEWNKASALPNYCLALDGAPGNKFFHVCGDPDMKEKFAAMSIIYKVIPGIVQIS
jgi:hypothetical protein